MTRSKLPDSEFEFLNLFESVGLVHSIRFDGSRCFPVQNAPRSPFTLAASHERNNKTLEKSNWSIKSKRVK